MVSVIVAQVLALAAGACVEGSLTSCSLAGCTRAYRECLYPGYGPCECYDPAPPPSPPQKPWYAVLNDGLTKVLDPSAITTPLTQASLRMAANEFEGFQLVVRPASGSSLSAVNFRIALADLGNASHPSLRARGGRVVIYRERYIDLGNRRSGPDGGVGWWPDALVPVADEIYGERRNAFGDFPNEPAWHVYYVEIYLPRGYQFGTLTGNLVASWDVSGQTYTFTVPVSVTQNALTLDSTSSLRTFYNTGWTPLCVSLTGNNDCSDNGLEQGLFDVQDQFIQYMLDHRLTPRLGWASLRPGTRSVSSWADRYQPFFNGTHKRKPGAVDVLPGSKIRAAAFEPGWALGAVTRDPVLYSQWKHELRTRGWYVDSLSGQVQTFDYTCDEPGNTGADARCPDPVVIPPREDAVHGVVSDLAPTLPATLDFPTLVTKPNQAEDLTSPISYCSDPYVIQYAKDVNIAVPNSQHVDDIAAASAFVSLPACSSSAVQDVWWYQACDVHDCGGATNTQRAGMPSLMIDVGCTPLPDGTSQCPPLVSGVQNRAMQWYTYYYGFSGELYYDFIAALGRPDAWSNVFEAGGNGDGTLLYPWNAADVGGSTRIPIGSLRLKALRDGMEDYEYLRELDRLCRPEAKTKVEALFGLNGHVLTVNANRGVTDLYRIRNEIADRVAALRANPGLCSGSTGGTCTCYGTGKKCFGPNGDWWYAGQYCNGAGDCVSYSCDVPY